MPNNTTNIAMSANTPNNLEYIMQAIEVKYIGATNTKPSRWKATASAGSVTLCYDYGLGSYENALQAATALGNKYEWLDNCTLQGGQLKNGNFVFTLSHN